MKKNVFRIVALTLTLVMLFVLIPAPSASAADASSICKLLDSYTAKPSTDVFNLTESGRFFVVSDTEPSGELLQTVQLIQRQYAGDGYDLPIVWGEFSWTKAGDIVIYMSTGRDFGEEGYELNIYAKAVIYAADYRGLIYGANMFQKIIRNCGTYLSGFNAKNTPDTKERTVQLDVARKYFTKEWVCNFIKEASWMGYNTLSLHFSEDGGFRADFWDPAYYKADQGYQPENDFTWLCGSHLQSWVKDPYRTDPNPGDYLETSELIEIINVAKEYHIDIIPNFDSPSHMDYLTWRFEKYTKDQGESFYFTYDGAKYYPYKSGYCINYNDTTGGATPTWPDYTTIDIREGFERSDIALAFVKSIYEDIADFFRVYAGSTKFGIGADEVNLTAAKNAWGYSRFPTYINSLNQLLKSKGYTMRMYNDFIKADYLTQFDSDIEIQFWNSSFDPNDGTTDQPEILPVSTITGRFKKVYNCIQTNTYFVLRTKPGYETSDGDQYDARSDTCKNWTFYHSDEDSIYNEWYPADIREQGDKKEASAVVSDEKIGGGYFLIWNDYAAVATEAEVWNGINSDKKWNVIDRMWSNIIKMWNWDINSTVTYATYSGLRDKFGYFPGYTSCSAKSNLPDAVAITQAYLADHTALTNALATKVSGVGYTTESYSAYEAVYAEAQTINADHGATEAELAQAIIDLNAAIAALTPVGSEVTIYYKTTVNGTEQTFRTEECPVVNSEFSIYIAPQTGYTYLRCEGASFTATASKDGSGTISGTARNPVVTLWYENTPSTDRMDYLLSNPIAADDAAFTKESWTAYEAAVAAAEAFVVTDTTTQSDIDALVLALEKARTELVATADSTSGGIISIEKLTTVSPLGKEVGLRVTTSPDVSTLTVDGEVLTVCVGRVQTLKTGEVVKIWLVRFEADEEGTFTYTVHAGSDSDTVDVTVQ